MRPRMFEHIFSHPQDPLIPAQADIQSPTLGWPPACAGMSGVWGGVEVYQ